MEIVVNVILNYLQTNRRLVVPAFGAFMVKESGERLFSELLRADDGVLVSQLRAKGYSEMESAVMIDRFIFEVRHELESFGYCRLGELGTLRVEPSTKSLRLYPPVQGEMPKSEPYVPQPVVVEKQEVEVEQKIDVAQSATKPAVLPVTPSVAGSPKQVDDVAASKTASTPRSRAKSRKRFDFVMVVAVIIVLAAVAAIGYGYYVSTLAEIDDAAIDALRVTPTFNE